MESDLLDYHQPPHHQKKMNSGLMRYQSAPSSYFSNILDSVLDTDFCQEFLKRPSSPETEKIIAGFLSNTGDAGDGSGGNTENNSPIREAVVKIEQQTQIMAPINNQTGVMQQQQQQGNYSSASQNFYQSQPQQQNLPTRQSGSNMDYRIPNSTTTGMAARPTQMKMGAAANNSNLIRHSSSPAGLFANINIENSKLFFLLIYTI